MSVSDEFKAELIERFRSFSPRDLSTNGFLATPQFFEDFERFKFPLIAYMSDKIEIALQEAPEGYSEDFLKGFVDGVVNTIRLLADVSLIREERDLDGTQG